MNLNPPPAHQLRIDTPVLLKKNGAQILKAARDRLISRWNTTPTSEVRNLMQHLDTLHLFLTQDDPAACPYNTAVHAATSLQTYIAE
jgi:hypothetical protein